MNIHGNRLGCRRLQLCGIQVLVDRVHGPPEGFCDQDFPEVNLNLVGILAPRWIYNKQYEIFTGGQADQHIALSRQPIG